MMDNKISYENNVKNYEKRLTKKIKRKFGRYYTPPKIVKLMLDSFTLNSKMKILEPGCGVGNFIVTIFEKLKQAYTSSNFSNKTLEELILKNNIFAIDNDAHAVKILKDFLDADKFEHNIKVGSFLSQTGFEKERFDIIIGNPPYAATLSKEEKKYCEKQFPDIFTETSDTAAFFTAKSIDLLKEGGYLSFIIPATILRVSKYSSLRRKIKRECFVKSIIDIRRAFEDVGYEVIVITLQKKNGATKPKEVEFITDLNLNKMTYKKHTLDYEFFEKRDIFPIFVSNDLVPIIKKIEANTLPLSEIAIMPRGLSITATDKMYISNKKISGYFEALRGRDIERFRIKPIKIYVKIPAHEFKKYSKLSKLKKIVVQNLAYRIVAALDEKHTVPLDTLNTVILKNNNFEYEYILCILNSKLISFYFQNLITNRARLNIHLDEPYLGQIPIKVINKTEQQKFVKLVKELTKNFDINLIEKINDEIFKLYGIENKKIIVENTING
jgi:type I restriction-modification system DNA methylase subunit